MADETTAGSPYVQRGYADRDDYLQGMAQEMDVPLGTVRQIAEVLGDNEDFDGLVGELEQWLDAEGGEIPGRTPMQPVRTRPAAGGVLLHAADGPGLHLGNGVGDLPTWVGEDADEAFMGRWHGLGRWSEPGTWIVEVCGPCWISLGDTTFERTRKVPEGRWQIRLLERPDAGEVAMALAQARGHTGGAYRIADGLGLSREGAAGRPGARDALHAALGRAVRRCRRTGWGRTEEGSAEVVLLDRGLGARLAAA